MKVQIIGKRLKEARLDKKITQKDLSALLGITPQALSKKENLDKTTLDELQIRTLEESAWFSRDFLSGKVNQPYECLGENEKLLIRPLIKDFYINPVVAAARTLNKQQLKTTLTILKFIAESNDYQLKLIENITVGVFNTSKDCEN